MLKKFIKTKKNLSWRPIAHHPVTHTRKIFHNGVVSNYLLFKIDVLQLIIIINIIKNKQKCICVSI